MKTLTRTRPTGAGPKRSRSRSRSGGRALTYLAVVLGFGALCLLYLPIAWMMLMSVSEYPWTGSPGPFTGKWYNVLFQSELVRVEEAKRFQGGEDFRVGGPLALSLVLAVIVAIACMVTGTMVGRVLPRIRARGRLLFIFLVPLMMPGIVAGGAIFMYYRVIIGVKMGVWSLVFAHYIWAFPFALLAMLVVASRFDERLLEAASDLGANAWQRFWQIEAPILKPGIFAAGFFGFLLSFNELPRSIFMRAGEMTLPLYLWAQSSAHATSLPFIFAMSAIVVIVSTILTFFAIRGIFKKEIN